MKPLRRKELAEQTAPALTPRQRELASALAALIAEDFKAFPRATDSSPSGRDREEGSPAAVW